MIDDPENNNSDENKPEDNIEKHDPVEDESVILTPTPSDATFIDVKAEEDKKDSEVSVSILKKRWKKFKTIKRGYYSFLIILFAYLISFALPLLINRNALIVHYNGQNYYPVFNFYSSETFGQDIPGEANYRLLNEQFKQQDGDNWVLMPLYPYGPNENLLDEIEGYPPTAPDWKHFCGTDNRGRDVFARLMYGFNISISFAIVVSALSYLIGVLLGAILGYYAGKVDIIGQRMIEIWSTLPFFYLIIIISSIVQPNFIILAVILTLFGWMSITYYIRGEFYREKSREYVQAAVSMGAKNRVIILKHVLPNSLVPIISFLPFAIVANINSLVALDYLGFGLPPPTPSWGELMNQGLSDITKWWLLTTPVASLFLTLLAIVFIGEAIREAFDPKVYSRLR
ncbi:MAG: ABC transporter permease [Ignavibacteriae bacterium]|nr:ABC transporter permease [Ignavibacteriota bacterium]